jgi:kynurenine formamidase
VSTERTAEQVSGWSRGSGWGWIWGDDDEVGALNAMTTETRLAALGSVTEGRVFDLGLTMERQSFVGSFHAHTEVLTYRTAEGFKAEQGIDPDGVSFNTTMVLISDHAGTQLDGLCHACFGPDNHWYNGYTSGESRSDFGPDVAAASGIPPIILQAVLLDVAGHKGVAHLGASFAIAPELLQSTLEAQEVEITPGDAVFIRTGALSNWGEAGRDHAALAEPDTAGITLAAARWLVEEKGAILIGSDTSTLEVMPPADGDNISPVHKYLLVDQGVHMGELHYLEELAQARAYKFCYIALTPKIKGTTGGFALRPIAVV